MDTPWGRKLVFSLFGLAKGKMGQRGRDVFFIQTYAFRLSKSGKSGFAPILPCSQTRGSVPIADIRLRHRRRGTLTIRRLIVTHQLRALRHDHRFRFGDAQAAPTVAKGGGAGATRAAKRAAAPTAAKGGGAVCNGGAVKGGGAAKANGGGCGAGASSSARRNRSPKKRASEAPSVFAGEGSPRKQACARGGGRGGRRGGGVAGIFAVAGSGSEDDESHVEEGMVRQRRAHTAQLQAESDGGE